MNIAFTNGNKRHAEQIEYYHNAGIMPDWAYYQQNGKSLQENYIEIKRRQQEKVRAELDRRRQQEQEKKEEAAALKELEKQIEKQAEIAIEKALDDVLKDFLK